MSTNADIILQTEDGYKSIYLHSDGYPQYALKMLQEHYADRDKVEGLIELGNVSMLAPSIECPEGHSFSTHVEGYSIFYGRDRGNAEQEAMYSELLEDHKENNFGYLYTLDGEWVVV